MAPTLVVVVGSFLLDTMVSPPNVDLVVEFPSQLLDEKDDISFRYFLKRSFFMATMAQTLCQVSELKSLELNWIPFRGHALSPSLVLATKDRSFSIRIHVSLSKGVFKGHRFAPGRNMVRKSALLTSTNLPARGALNQDDVMDSPTPIYNSLFQMDFLRVEHLKMIHAECKRIPALKDAMKLGKAWIHQRGYQKFNFHFSGFQFSMICVYLAISGRINSHMTDLQIFKEAMVFCEGLAIGKLVLFPTLPPFFKEFPEEFSSQAYSKGFAASLVEPSLGMNILFDWTPEVVAEIRRDAKAALTRLLADDLSTLFLKKDIQSGKYDSYVLVSECEFMPDLKANFSHFASQFIPEVARAKLLAKKMKFALGTRIENLAVHSLASSAISIFDSAWIRPVTDFALGLVFNRDECQRIVEMGPLADQMEETQYFRHFWKTRAELRRFPDGSIREAVAWDHLSSTRHKVIPDIVRFVMEFHFDGASADILDNSLDFAWLPNSEFSTSQEAVRKFAKTLQGLPDLPLSISRCETISSIGRMTSVNPPTPIQEHVNPLKSKVFSDVHTVTEMLIRFEKSSRWPDEYYGMLFAKQAFAVQICRGLNDHFGLHTSITSNFFDVLFQGFVFRCYIHHEDEGRLLQSQDLDPSEVVLRNELRPKHARTINVLATGDFNFAPTCRLVKRWISSHFYALQFPEELVELIVAREFLKSDRPKSVVSGFIRVLCLISEFAWQEAPLLVDFEHGESKTWSCRVAKQQFAESSQRPLLWVSPSYEATGGCCFWSHQCALSSEDLQTLCQLASTVVVAFEKRTVTDFKVFFRPSLDRFDVHGNVEFRNSEKCLNLMHRNSLGIRFLRSLPGFNPMQDLISDIQDSLPNVRVYCDSFSDGNVLAFKLPENDQSPSELRTQLLSLSDGALSFK